MFFFYKIGIKLQSLGVFLVHDLVIGIRRTGLTEKPSVNLEIFKMFKTVQVGI